MANPMNLPEPQKTEGTVPGRGGLGGDKPLDLTRPGPRPGEFYLVFIDCCYIYIYVEHKNKYNSPGLGPGRVRSRAGLVIFLVLVLVIGWGKVYLPPLPPFPGHLAPKCAFPKVGVSLLLDIKKTP